MNKLMIATVLVAMTSTAALADGLTALGLDDPEVMAPPSASGDWDGPYVGLSYGRTSTKSTGMTSEGVYEDRCVKSLDGENPYVGDDDQTFPRECGDTSGGYTTVVIERVLVDTIETLGETSTSQDDFGAFVGWRKDWGNIVGGVELGVLGDMSTLEAQVGLDLGKVLAYGAVGFGDLSGESGEVYSVGADMQVGKRVLVGVKYTQGSFGTTDTDTTSLRVGLTF